MLKLSFISFGLIIFIFIGSCSKNDKVLIAQFEKKASQIQKQIAPDLSLSVFNLKLNRVDNKWQIEGESSVSGFQSLISSFADSLLGKDQYSINVKKLPDFVLGDSSYAIITVSTAHLRRHPKHSAEMVDQSITGNVVRILKKQGMWYLVQTHYGYLGWVARYSLHQTDSVGVAEWENSKRVRMSALSGIIHSKPNTKSEPVADVVMNASLKMINKGSNWTKIKLPDGREGFILNKFVEKIKKTDSKKISAKNIIKTARSMMGIPYFWGGNSTKANDCSGFTQIVFKAHGMQLPRDARQQARMGEEINPEDDFSNVLSGDLIFFGVSDRITHVAISLGDYDFIHQDSEVNIDSFDENAENYNDFRRKSLKKIKRIIQ